MREQLTRYVDLLFAGAPNAGDIRQEILQNTLDRYDDLIAQGKTPQAAYSLAISGIGDINEILSDIPDSTSIPAAVTQPEPEIPVWKKIVRTVAIFLYIICPIPLFVLSELGMDTLGLCGLLGIVAVATALMLISSSSKTSQSDNKAADTPLTPQQELLKSINSIIWTVGLCTYFILSFVTQAWHVTWLVFLIISAANGLVKAILDLKEASSNET